MYLNFRLKWCEVVNQDCRYFGRHGEGDFAIKVLQDLAPIWVIARRFGDVCAIWQAHSDSHPGRGMYLVIVNLVGVHPFRGNTSSMKVLGDLVAKAVLA